MGYDLTEQKFCADCKWVLKDEKKPHDWVCTAPKIRVRFDLVSGNAMPNYCAQVRLGDDCGPAGHLWEPAEIRMA
jgi:hypothetical protein